jgi:hypothetical protein
MLNSTERAKYHFKVRCTIGYSKVINLINFQVLCLAHTFVFFAHPEIQGISY